MDTLTLRMETISDVELLQYGAVWSAQKIKDESKEGSIFLVSVH